MFLLVVFLLRIYLFSKTFLTLYCGTISVLSIRSSCSCALPRNGPIYLPTTAVLCVAVSNLTIKNNCTMMSVCNECLAFFTKLINSIDLHIAGCLVPVVKQ